MFFFLNDPATTEIYPLSLHDALPIYEEWDALARRAVAEQRAAGRFVPGLGHPVHKSADPRTAVIIALAEQEGLRSEEHTSELQSQSNLVCRLLLETKKNIDDV